MTTMTRLQSALWLPIFDELADTAWSHVWPPRPRRPAGTACSYGITCAGGRRLSGGRLTLGVGLGSDRYVQEFSATGATSLSKGSGDDDV